MSLAYLISDEHPGKILKVKLAEKNLSQFDLARITGITPTHIGYIVKGKRTITPPIAMALGNVFDITWEQWLERQMKFSNYQTYQKALSLRAGN